MSLGLAIGFALRSVAIDESNHASVIWPERSRCKYHSADVTAVKHSVGRCESGPAEVSTQDFGAFQSGHQVKKAVPGIKLHMRVERPESDGLCGFQMACASVMPDNHARCTRRLKPWLTVFNDQTVLWQYAFTFCHV